MNYETQLKPSLCPLEKTMGGGGFLSAESPFSPGKRADLFCEEAICWI